MTPEQPPPPAFRARSATARDPLTGLADRDHFHHQLRNLIAHTCRESDRLAVVFIDLPGLEPIRQDHGDRAGDAALVEFASRIRASARRVDVCARLQDNGFAVILPHIADRAVAMRVQDRFRESVGIPFDFEGTSMNIQARCGIALFPDDAQDAESLVARASPSPSCWDVVPGGLNGSETGPRNVRKRTERHGGDE